MDEPLRTIEALLTLALLTTLCVMAVIVASWAVTLGHDLLRRLR